MPVTPILGLQLPIVGDTADTWGAVINNDLSVIDNLAASVPISVSSTGASIAGVALETIELCVAGTGIIRTLPDPNVNVGRIFTFVKTDATVGTVTIVGTINGVSNYVLINIYQFVRVVAGGGAWTVVGSN